MPNSYQEYTAKKPEIFFTAEQLPHAEILTHPAIAIALSAADFNSTMICIAQGVPMLCFPHFGNQGAVAQNMLKAGAGLCLLDPAIVENRHDDMANYTYS